MPLADHSDVKTAVGQFGFDFLGRFAVIFDQKHFCHMPLLDCRKAIDVRRAGSRRLRTAINAMRSTTCNARLLNTKLPLESGSPRHEEPDSAARLTGGMRRGVRRPLGGQVEHRLRGTSAVGRVQQDIVAKRPPHH